MVRTIEKLLDRIGINLLNALQKNARISFSDLGRKVGLSSPAVTERVRKLEEAGVVRGYHAVIDASRVGFPVTAFIHLTTPSHHYPKINAIIKTLNEVLECHHISGEESFILKVLSPSVPHLETLVNRLSPYGQTRTAIVLSTQILRSGIELG